MINDIELLKLIMDRYPEQSLPFVIEQFTELKAGLVQANNRISAADAGDILCEPKDGEAGDTEELSSVKKKFTRRNLILRPEEALHDGSITCCLCGRSFQNLNARHLQSHGISMDEYKKLCGYDPNQALISKNLMAELQQNASKARQAREAKRT